MLQDDFILSRVALLKDKCLLCCTHTTQIPSIDTDVWSMTCHSQVLLYLINIFEDDRAEDTFYKVSRNSWSTTQCILADQDDGTYKYFYNDDESLVFPYEDQCGSETLYEDPRKSYKHVVSKCLCRRCRKIVYCRYSGHRLTNLELYHHPSHLPLDRYVSLSPEIINNLMRESGRRLTNFRKVNFPHNDEAVLPAPLKFNRAGRI